MKQVYMVFAITLLFAGSCRASTVVLTFDGFSGMVGNHYEPYCVVFSSGYRAESHVGSDWGPPRSGSNVLVADQSADWSGRAEFILKSLHQYPIIHYASSIGGYFSTEPGVVLEMIGYHDGFGPVASATIGSPEESWNNVYVQIDSAWGICAVDIYPVTDHALLHFCADDLTIDFIPEPSSAAAILAGMAGVAVMRRRRKT